MTRALDDLVRILSVEPLGEDRFRGIGSWGDGVDATFGGHFLGQATAAAMNTVDDDRHIHSLHAYFLRGGKPGEPIDYTVTRVRNGRSFCTRRVSAAHGAGPPAFELTASFTVPAEGRTIAPAPPADFAELPRPETLPTYFELMRSQDPLPLPEGWALREHGVDVRVVNAPYAPRGPSPAQGIRMWIRTHGTLPDDPRLHAAMFAYQSDESAADNVAVPFGVTWGSPGVVFVSLDHALWYHQPFRMDEWLFVEQWPVTATNGRGLATGEVWNQAGERVASFSQEALMRF